MNRKRLRKWSILLGLLALCGAGCSPGTLGFLFRDTNTKPEYPMPPREVKKEIVVLVMVSKSANLGADPMFATVDGELAGLVNRTLTEGTKDSKHPIRCIEQSKLQAFKTSARGDWRTMSPATIGTELGADYVIDVNVTTMTIFQAEYAREFCQGRASADVTVYDTAQPDKILQQFPHNSMQQEKSVVSMPPTHYRRWFTERLARELAWRHIPHDSNERLAANAK